MHELAKCVQWVLILGIPFACFCMLPSGFTSRLHVIHSSSPPNVRPSWLPWHVIDTVTRYEISLNFVIVTDVMFLLIDWFYYILFDRCIPCDARCFLKHLWFFVWKLNEFEQLLENAEFFTSLNTSVFILKLEFFFTWSFPSGSKSTAKKRRHRNRENARRSHRFLNMASVMVCQPQSVLHLRLTLLIRLELATEPRNRVLFSNMFY